MNNINLEISAILDRLLKRNRLSEAELSRKINVPRATINRLVSGRTPNPRASTLQAIAEYFNVTMDQLLGKHPLYTNQNEIATVRKSIPIIEWASAHTWENAVAASKPSNHSHWVMIDPSVEQGKFVLQINGEAMWPQFQEKTLLIIDPIKEPKNRDFVIAYIKEKNITVFRQLVHDDQYQFLKAINTIFPTLQLQRNDKIIGVVIQTRNNFK